MQHYQFYLHTFIFKIPILLLFYPQCAFINSLVPTYFRRSCTTFLFSLLIFSVYSHFLYVSCLDHYSPMWKSLIYLILLSLFSFFFQVESVQQKSLFYSNSGPHSHIFLTVPLLGLVTLQSPLSGLEKM